MDYNKLKIFVTVAEHQSISAAARELRRTQSAVTQQIQKLEGELGFQVFERKQSRVFLTREGESLYASGKPLLNKIDEKVTELKNDLKLVEGSVSIGVIEDFATKRLSRIVAAFKQKFPLIQIKIVYGTGWEIEQALIQNRCDIGILITFRDKSFFKITPLREDDNLLVTSKAYLKSRGSLDTFEKIIEADLIDFSADFHCMGIWVKSNKPKLMTKLMQKKPAITLENHSGIKAIVASGFGVGILPRYLVEDELKSGEFVQLMKSSKPNRTGLDVAVRKVRNESLAEKIFLQFLREESRKN